jgi:tetratricopeptide (TPR) repeat protein
VFFAEGNGAKNVSRTHSTANLSKHDFEKGLSGYQTLERQGIKTVGLYNNMGYLYYSARDYTLSLLYYEKALELAPFNKQIIRNREQVLNTFAINVIDNNSGFHSDNFFKIKATEYSNVFLTIVMLLSAFGFLFFSLKKKGGSYLNFFKTTLITAMVLMIVVGVVYYIQSNNYVVVTQKAHLHLGPSATSKVCSRIPEGYVLKITNTQGEWVEVEDYAGKYGWLTLAALRKI